MFGEHAAFIIPAYIISFFALAGIAAVTVVTHRKRKAELAALELSSDTETTDA